MSSADGRAYLWELAEPLLARGALDESTMMGQPCLRANGAFVAMVDTASAGMVVKLPEARVGTLVDEGSGAAFAPAGKVFREWVLVADRPKWAELLDEAVAFAGSA